MVHFLLGEVPLSTCVPMKWKARLLQIQVLHFLTTRCQANLPSTHPLASLPHVPARPRYMYMGTSLIRNHPPPAPYSRALHRALWWS